MLALIPILALMATGAITPMDAAIRAASVGVVVIALGNIARIVLTGALRRVERRATAEALAEQDAEAHAT
jgi:hypothetical protein